MSKLQNYLQAATCANTEDDVDELLKMMSPTEDREEMGELYEFNLGYNPITHFDEQELNVLLNEMIEEAPTYIKEKIVDAQETIIKDSLEYHSDHLTSYLTQALTYAIERETGWTPGITGSIDSTARLLQTAFEVDEDEILDEDADEDDDDFSFSKFTDEDDDLDEL